MNSCSMEHSNLFESYDSGQRTNVQDGTARFMRYISPARASASGISITEMQPVPGTFLT